MRHKLRVVVVHDVVATKPYQIECQSPATESLNKFELCASRAAGLGLLRLIESVPWSNCSCGPGFVCASSACEFRSALERDR